MLILSLCDFSGVWSQPYENAGYQVVRLDLQTGDDIRLLPSVDVPVHGILAAPPCTCFTASGAQYWPAKDADGRTLQGLAVVDACLRQVALCRPDWWVLENPVGRLRRWLGPPAYVFDPCDFGDPWTKKTLLWGRFKPPFKSDRIAPFNYGKSGNWCEMLGSWDAQCKMIKSVTPPGFARAFFEANP